LRRLAVLLAATVLTSVSTLTPATPVYAAGPILPNLQMLQLSDFQLGSDPTLPGRKLLRFTATIVNVGAGGGTFEVIGTRPDTATTTMSVQQILHNEDGTTTSVPTSAHMVWDNGDGHNHWHTADLERYLLTTPNGRQLTSPKVGYCFFDNDPALLYLPGAPQQPVFLGCGEPSSLSVDTGLSVGWGDSYHADRYQQWVDITDQGNGQYHLQATADPYHYFTETNANDNTTWVDLSIRGNKLKVLRYGP
jgi:hypothetical protein